MKRKKVRGKKGRYTLEWNDPKNFGEGSGWQIYMKFDECDREKALSWIDVVHSVNEAPCGRRIVDAKTGETLKELWRK